MDKLNTSISDKIVAQYVHLARKIARKYAVQGHVILGFEDLYQELQMCLVRCASAARDKKMPEKEIYYYVSTALSNAAKYLLTRAFGKKRNCIVVELDLSDEVARIGTKDFDNIHERILLQQVRSLLSGVSLQVYDAILNPSAEMVVCAQATMMRKAHLKKANNITVRGANVVRVTKDIIREVLGISHDVYDRSLDAIRSAALSVVQEAA